MLEQYDPKEYFVCPRPCRNITFATDEIVTCTCCGRRIQFFPDALPKSISYPVSRRKWGERTPITSAILKYTTKNWQNAPSETVWQSGTLLPTPKKVW